MTFVCRDWEILQLALEEGIECQIQGFEGDFRFLSNFFPVAIEVHRIVYPTVEHAYQAAKATSRAERLEIASLESPGQAKRYGANLRVNESWNSQKLSVMEDLLKQKFQVSDELRTKLISMGDCYLEETNTWGDHFSGVCNNIGENHLGRLLMRIRELYRMNSHRYRPCN